MCPSFFLLQIKYLTVFYSFGSTGKEPKLDCMKNSNFGWRKQNQLNQQSHSSKSNKIISNCSAVINAPRLRRTSPRHVVIIRLGDIARFFSQREDAVSLCWFSAPEQPITGDWAFLTIQWHVVEQLPPWAMSAAGCWFSERLGRDRFSEMPLFRMSKKTL